MSALLRELLPFAALGVLGALHCAGMCGAFAIAVTTSGSGAARATLRRQTGYVVGKALTYGVLGLALSAGVGGLVSPRLADATAWLAGGVLVVLGLGWLGWLPRLRAPRLLRGPRTARALERLRTVQRELLRLPGFAGAFGAGAVNGLVPCGLSWAAIAMAATATPAAALLGPFVFGLATAPSLALVGAGAWLVRRPSLARVAPLAIGAALVLGGALTAMRGAPGARTTDGAPACCDHAPAAFAPHAHESTATEEP